MWVFQHGPPSFTPGQVHSLIKFLRDRKSASALALRTEVTNEPKKVKTCDRFLVSVVQTDTLTSRVGKIIT